MSTETAKRDPNYAITIQGVDMTTGSYPTNVYVDEVTHRLLVNASISSNVEVTLATRIFPDGTTTYICKAPAGTLANDPGWQVKKIAVSGSNTFITWADGNTNFDNVATNLAAVSGLSYS